MTTQFVVGRLYTREQVADEINLPQEKWRGGNWVTGYDRWNGEVFIFCNIGVAGRTGHDYDNRWVDKELLWLGKTHSKLSQPMIQEMVLGRSPVHVFWRGQDRAPFSYAGRASALSTREVSPVEVIWTFENELQSDVVGVSQPTWRRGPPPSHGVRTAIRVEGETYVYVFMLEGSISAMLPYAGPEAIAIKVGMSNQPARRLVELNLGFPPGSLQKWVLVHSRRYDTGIEAYLAEGRCLEHLRITERWIGGEFAVIQQQELPGLLSEYLG